MIPHAISKSHKLPKPHSVSAIYILIQIKMGLLLPAAAPFVVAFTFSFAGILRNNSVHGVGNSMGGVYQTMSRMTYSIKVPVSTVSSSGITENRTVSGISYTAKPVFVSLVLLMLPVFIVLIAFPLLAIPISISASTVAPAPVLVATLPLSFIWFSKALLWADSHQYKQENSR